MRWTDGVTVPYRNDPVSVTMATYNAVAISGVIASASQSANNWSTISPVAAALSRTHTQSNQESGSVWWSMRT